MLTSAYQSLFARKIYALSGTQHLTQQKGTKGTKGKKGKKKGLKKFKKKAQEGTKRYKMGKHIRRGKIFAVEKYSPGKK